MATTLSSHPWLQEAEAGMTADWDGFVRLADRWPRWSRMCSATTYLRKGVAPDLKAYLRDIARTINALWDMSAGADLGFPAIEGKRTLKVRMINYHVAKLQAAATVDGSLTDTSMRPAGLVAPPESLMKPKVLLKTLRNAGAVPAVPAPRTAPADVPAAEKRDVSGV